MFDFERCFANFGSEFDGFGLLVVIGRCDAGIDVYQGVADGGICNIKAVFESDHKGLVFN